MAGAGLVLCAATTAGAQITVNFDAFTGMTNIPGSVVPTASRLSTQLLSSGVRFASLSDYIAVVDLGSGTPSATNGIGGTSAAGALDYSAPIIVSFWDPTNSLLMGTTNFVQIRGDLIPIPGTVTMNVFDPFGALLASITLPDIGGTTLTYSGANVQRVEITGSTATVAFDDLTFNTVSAVPNAQVPEPSSLALFGGGAALLSVLARARRASRAGV